MEYFIDKERKYFDDLLFHLRAHNKSITGPKEKIFRHIYIYDNDQLVGYASAGASWDWVGAGTYYYQSIDILKTLISEICKEFKDLVVGFKAFTVVEEFKNDLLQSGFYLDATLYAEKRLGQRYYLDLEDINYSFEHNYKVVIKEEELEEHKEFIKKYNEDYEKTHDLNVTQNEILYVAIENDEFVGGVSCQEYQESLHVHLLATNNKYKGQGVGTKLMNYIEDYARSKNLEFIDLGTASFQARPFYEKLGYKVVHTRKNQPVGFECYQLVKMLGD